jgi:hypothetical protein
MRAQVRAKRMSMSEQAAPERLAPHARDEALDHGDEAKQTWQT